ncbi:MAG: class I adenylate-forming enzyme family protein [Candidatus Korobacteraceae bacterium]
MTSSLLPHQQLERPVNLPYANFFDLLKTHTDRAPDRLFVLFPESGREYTYRQFFNVALAAAEWLSVVAPGQETIALVLRNTPEFLAIYFGAVFLGITVVPINPDLAPRETRFIIENSQSSTLFYDPVFQSKIAVLENEMSPAVKFLAFGNVADLPKVDAPAVEARLPRVEPTTPAVIIYTSGTTGNPKGVLLSHMNFLADGKAVSEWFEFTPDTRSLCILPLFHNNGLVMSLTTTLYQGGSIVWTDPKSSLRSFWPLVEKYQATFTSVMPSVLAAILAFGLEGRRSSLQGIICGGQLLPLSLAEQFEARFGVPIFEGFGSTEASSYSSFNPYPAEKRKLGSVGKVLPVSEMKVVDEADVEVPDGTEGELCIRGINVAIGYLKLPELQTLRFRNGWYHSGDYGYRDKDGFYYFRGRKDDLIVKGGEKIYPAEVENVLSLHPNVAESAVVGVDDAILGQEICAFVRLKDDGASNETELLEYCGKSLARFKQPKRIVIINRLGNMPELPKGPTKKILHRELRDYYQKCLAVSEAPAV